MDDTTAYSMVLQLSTVVERFKYCTAVSPT